MTKITAIRQVNVSCIYWGLSMKCCLVQKDCGRSLFGFISECVVGKKLNTSHWSSMADGAITRGSIGGLGSLVYISGLTRGIALCNRQDNF